ncbi:MAG: polysaccharide biosynthesis protein [Lachnospiraceae bacterium]|nr:polysaccharide biosynthesis protein [Lachnospiraceae bacterium]
MKRTYTRTGHEWIWRAFLIAFLDAVIVAGSYYVSLLARFDFSFEAIPKVYLNRYWQLIGIYILITIVVFYLFRLYHSIWRFASISELARLLLAWIVIEALIAAVYLITKKRMPWSFWIPGAVLSFLGTAGLRFSYRFLRSVLHRFGKRAQGTGEVRVMTIGAGEAGRAIIHELTLSDRLDEKAVCVIDDNPAKKRRLLDGVPVVGNRNDIPAMVKKYKINKIIFAIPTATATEKKEILEICETTGCKLQMVPGIYQLVDGRVSVSQLRDVDLVDLLGREPIRINNDEVHQFIGGKVVMVTGGGGSIGSEICRQIAKDDPKLLIIFDIYENNAYEIQQELKRQYGDKLKLEVLIGSVRNTSRIESIMSEYHPDILIHAAAHKHVPLMEDSPCEAIKNNPVATYKMARAAARYGVERFVLISTDKAVNPTNVMGASKRMCEMVIQMMQRRGEGKTVFTAVRFGNVLGSNGSVIPLFRKQIAAGGPVTVTDRRITRYFMTIPEAVSLVLQSAYYAKGGEIFVLDMGEPVKIDDMARRLIRLSGYEPDVDIKIEYTGLRPGEKLYEELLMGEEGLQETPNKLIHIAQPIQMDDEQFAADLEMLDEDSREEDPDIREKIARIIPTYHPDSIGDLRTAAMVKANTYENVE